MTSSPVRRTLLAAAAVGALVAGATVADARSAPAPVPQPVVVPVATTRLICPDPYGSSQVGTLVNAFIAPGQPGEKAPRGTAVLSVPRKLGIPGKVYPLTKVGQSISVSTQGRWFPPVTGLATGAFAPGFVADQVSAARAGQWQGITATPCSVPSTERWFVGGGSTPGRTSQVVLSNPESGPASVDTVIFGPDGEVAAPGGRGVIVPPKSQVRLDLSTLAPGLPIAVIHVVVRSGRVAAAMSDRAAAGLLPQGVDWVPASAAPAGRVVVPGIPSAAASVRLSIVSPSADASVVIRVITPDGAFRPAGLDELDLTPGRVATVDLSPALKQANVAVEVVATAPVVAGATLLTAPRARERERMFAAGAVPLTAPAAIAWLDGSAKSVNSLLLTSVGGPSTALVTRYPRDGKPVTTTVQVASDRTVLVPVPIPDQVSSSLLVTPGGSGRLYAAREWVWTDTGISGFSGYPLAPMRTTATIPPSRPDLAVAQASG